MKSNLALGICFVLLLSFGCVTHPSDSSKYIVDPSIEEEIDSKTDFDKIYFGQVDLEIYQNDSIIFTSMDTTATLSIMVMNNLDGDSIWVRLLTGFMVGLGCDINIYQNDFTLQYYTKTDDWGMYKLSESDTTLQLALLVPTVEQKLTLAKEPEFKEGELIKGIVELKSEPFWEVMNGVESKYRVSLKAWFTDQLKSMEK